MATPDDRQITTGDFLIPHRTRLITLTAVLVGVIAYSIALGMVFQRTDSALHQIQVQRLHSCQMENQRHDKIVKVVHNIVKTQEQTIPASKRTAVVKTALSEARLEIDAVAPHADCSHIRASLR